MKDKAIRQQAIAVYRAYRNRVSPDDEYLNWTEYRDALTGFILKHISPGDSIIIYGAGKCNDIDLGKLAEHAEQITLSDCLADAMVKAAETYPVHRHQISMECTDYVGIPDEAYIDFTSMLLESFTTDADVKQKLTDKLSEIYMQIEHYHVPMPEAVYDYGIIIGVHSQLNNVFSGVWDYVYRVISSEKEDPIMYRAVSEIIQEITSKYTQGIVRRLNKTIFDRVRKGVFYGYETAMTDYLQSGELTRRIAGAAQAAEEADYYKTVDTIKCNWPLSQTRDISFCMDIRLLEAV